MSVGEVFGARGRVRIYYSGDLYGLAAILADAFKIDGFSIEPEEYEPFEDVGFAEAFGFEAWLSQLPEGDGGWYGLELCTDHSMDEILYDRMHDISGWLARFVVDMCELQATAAHDGWGGGSAGKKQD